MRDTKIAVKRCRVPGGGKENENWIKMQRLVPVGKTIVIPEGDGS